MGRMLKPWLCVSLVCLVSSPAAAESSDVFDTGLRLDNIEKELELISSQMQNLNSQMQELSDEVKKIKECDALARQKPESLEEYSSGLNGRFPNDFVLKTYREGVVARINCGLPTKGN